MNDFIFANYHKLSEIDSTYALRIDNILFNKLYYGIGNIDDMIDETTKHWTAMHAFAEAID